MLFLKRYYFFPIIILFTIYIILFRKQTIKFIYRSPDKKETNRNYSRIRLFNRPL